MVATFKILGTPDATDELKQTIVDGVLAKRETVPWMNSHKPRTNC